MLKVLKYDVKLKSNVYYTNKNIQNDKRFNSCTEQLIHFTYN